MVQAVAQPEVEDQPQLQYDVLDSLVVVANLPSHEGDEELPVVVTSLVPGHRASL